MGIVLASYAPVGSRINAILLESEILDCLQSLQAPLSHVLKPRPPSAQNGRSASPPGQPESACQTSSNKKMYQRLIWLLIF